MVDLEAERSAAVLQSLESGCVSGRKRWGWWKEQYETVEEDGVLLSKVRRSAKLQVLRMDLRGRSL